MILVVVDAHSKWIEAACTYLRLQRQVLKYYVHFYHDSAYQRQL